MLGKVRLRTIIVCTVHYGNNGLQEALTNSKLTLAVLGGSFGERSPRQSNSAVV